MSKRKARPAPKKATGKRGMIRRATNGSGKPLVPPKRKKAPKRRLQEPALPGLEQVRSARLDLICEGIADARAAKGKERDLIATALLVMQRDGTRGYKHAGVELEYVPGVDHVKVHVIQDEGVTEVDPPKRRRQSPIPEVPRVGEAPQVGGSGSEAPAVAGGYSFPHVPDTPEVL